MYLNVQKLKLFVLLFMFYEVSLAQLSAHGELGLGIQDNNNSATLIEGGVGYSYLGIYGFGGMKLGVHNMSNYPFSSYNQRNPFDEYLFNFSLLTGLRYNISIYKNSSASIEHIGVFPEYRFYYTPFLTNKISYYNDQEEIITVTGGGAQSNFAQGFGIGIFAGELDEGAFYLKFEFNTLNPFKVLNTLSYENSTIYFGAPQQYAITLGYYYID